MYFRAVGARLGQHFHQWLNDKKGILIKYMEELRQRRHGESEKREHFLTVLSPVLETSISDISFHLYDNSAGEMSLSSFY